MKYWRDF